MRWIIIGLGATAVAGYVLFSNEPASEVQTITAGAGIVAVTLPDALSQNAQIGGTIYDAKCAACHGANGAGQDGVAPPLVHKIYEPGHHGDEAFQRAAALGVQQHHWPFGNMAPVEGLTRGDVAAVVAYIRELQVANGIR